MYSAVLDTCVLVPDLQRDFLLQLAAEWSYAPLWGTGILTELEYVLGKLDEERGLHDRGESRRHLLTQMDLFFPGSRIEAPKGRTYGYGLADPGDEHVAHAALFGKADAIVTSDRRSGMEYSHLLRQASIEVIEPQVFAANTVIAHKDAGVRAIFELAQRRRRPPSSPMELLERLRDRFAMEEVYEHLHRPLME